ncbi:MAG TPA: hypothetical protein VGF77_00625 [Allosphingosinicella sp.]
MKRTPFFIAAAAILLAAPAAAQLTGTPHAGEQSIIVTGERIKGVKPPEMSNWRVAETPHVLVFSKGDPKELTRIADHLEKLHFLLSILLNRIDQPDQTLKISVTLIGDRDDFDHLGLHNIRWQQGPYPSEFPDSIYYDPREDGAVMATAHTSQCFAVVRDAAVLNEEDLEGIDFNVIAFSPDLLPADETAMAVVMRGVGEANARSNGANHCKDNPNKVTVTAESRLYSAFAQHYLLTYFPAAYPRWYLEGFGEIFANMDADKQGVIEYGRWPEKYRLVLDKFGHYPVRKVLDGTYLHDPHWSPAFSPYTAWGLAHLLFFAPEWKAPLHDYLAAIAKGERSRDAEAKLGDVRRLQRQLAGYYGREVPFERLTYPVDRFQPPFVRQLKQSEAVYVRGRLELGARVTIAGADEAARKKAVAARDHWLADLRTTAAAYPSELADQQLLAEAECRSGNGSLCVAAADRALSLAANDPVSLTWKGYGLTLEAVQAPPAERASLLADARASIASANHFDTESVLPLLAYYRSYALAGEPVPDVAIDGLAKSLDEVPAAPTTRLMLGTALVNHADPIDARRILLPLADGAFDPPEKPNAQQLLTRMTPKPMAANAIGKKTP